MVNKKQGSTVMVGFKGMLHFRVNRKSENISLRGSKDRNKAKHERHMHKTT